MKCSTSLSPIGGLLALGLSLPALAAPSTDFPTYTVGPQKNGSIIASNLQRLTPAGRQIGLGSPVRAKAVALNPIANSHTAAILEMGASEAVKVIDTKSGVVLQSFIPAQDSSGSFTGITYSADGKYLFFSQDSSYLEIAKVDGKGLLSDYGRVTLPPDTSIPLYTSSTANPAGVAVSADGKSAYVLLNQNNTLGVVDLTGSAPVLKQQIHVGNDPNSIVIANGFAYVTNTGGRVAASGDFTDLSSGTPIVANPATDASSTGTVSVIDLATNQVVNTIDVGLQPTGLTVSGSTLYVVNTNSENVSVVDLKSGRVKNTISLAIPYYKTFGTEPSGIATDGNYLFIASYTTNSILVVDLAANYLIGSIPTAYGPSTVAYDAANQQLIVTNDKGTGAQGSIGSAHGVSGYNTHQDTGTVSLIHIPTLSQLLQDNVQVAENNHWDLFNNTLGTFSINPGAKPVAVPAHIGEPSLIKHVFLFIKENRTYDQILGDVAKGNGDSSLAVFGAVTPNQHALVQRFPLLDNVYAPSRQSADGHPWIVSSISSYSNDIQSPDWVRSYPGGNSNDVMTYTPQGFLWQTVKAAGHSVKMYGEWSDSQVVDGNYSWSDWYKASQIMEGKISGTSPITLTTDTESTKVPSAEAILDPHYPSFNTGIPDQYRVDVWMPQFLNYEATNTLPDMEIIWLPDDHTSGFTTGFPIPTAAQADNDLALGRMVDAITHSKDWPTTAIFVEEDDAQDGVDHVDGHRQPVYVISPYAKQFATTADHTSYTAENINRTIENIFGAQPLTQFDLVASPMRTVFTNTPNTAPYDMVPATLDPATFPTPTASVKGASSNVRNAWQLASDHLMAGHTNHADSVDENVLNHVIWYASTDFSRPYPGEKKVLPPTSFHPRAVTPETDD